MDLRDTAVVTYRSQDCLQIALRQSTGTSRPPAAVSVHVRKGLRQKLHRNTLRWEGIQTFDEWTDGQTQRVPRAESPNRLTLGTAVRTLHWQQADRQIRGQPANT
jgi:hypothetical protein